MNTASSNGPVFDPKQTVAAAISRSVFELAVDSAISAAVVAVPFLATPVVNQIFAFLVRSFMNLFYANVEESVSFAVIDARVNIEDINYKDSVSKLEIAVAGRDAVEIENARQEFKSHLRSLISLKP